MGKIGKILKSLLLVILVFYVIYPVALPLFGFSFIFTSGCLGLIVYAYNRYPFTEVVTIILLFLSMIAWGGVCTFLNSASDAYGFSYTKSQIAWIFSAYLITYIFFRVHPNGGLRLIVYYVIAAITLQGILSVWMYFDPNVAAFLTKISMSSDLSVGKRGMTEGKRLLGYGIEFFGAGLVFGLSLILIVYIFMSQKLNLIKQIFWALLYVATFLVGIMSARTALVGLVASLILLVVLFFTGNTSNRSQAISVLFYSTILVSIGVGMVFQFFPDFAEWAFEPFINYTESGEIRTSSSDGLAIMWRWPSNIKEWLIGWGRGDFWGSDVGYTRLFFWFGLPGTILFFYYQFKLIKLSFSGDKAFNLTLVAIFGYNMALNVKGLSDLNHFLYIFLMYFFYYRYFIYTPYLYRIGKIRPNTLRHAVQGSTSGRRI